MIRYSYYIVWVVVFSALHKLTFPEPLFGELYYTTTIPYLVMHALVLFPNTYVLWRIGEIDTQKLTVGLVIALIPVAYLVFTYQAIYLVPIVFATYSVVAVFTIKALIQKGVRGLQAFVLPILSIWLFPALASLADRARDLDSGTE